MLVKKVCSLGLILALSASLCIAAETKPAAAKAVSGKITEEALTEAQVIGIVDSAAKLIAQKGDEALKVIGETDGKFHKGALYVFVYDENVNMVAHPENHSLVGKNFKGKPDVKGKMFRDEIVEKAIKNGSGWTDYLYQKPGETGLFKKKTYGKLVTYKNKKYIVCAGMYADK